MDKRDGFPNLSSARSELVQLIIGCGGGGGGVVAANAYAYAHERVESGGLRDVLRNGGGSPKDGRNLALASVSLAFFLFKET